MTPDSNAPATPVAGTAPGAFAPRPPGANGPPPAGADRRGLPDWARLPIFVVAALVAASLSLLSARQIQYEMYVRTPVYIAPRDATDEQRQLELESIRRRIRWMDCSALAAAAALTAGLLGAAGGLCRAPAGAAAASSRGRRTLRGAGAGLGLGAAAGVLAALVTLEILVSDAVSGWGGAVGDRQLFPAMFAYAFQLGLIGAAAGIAVRFSLGKAPKWSLAGAMGGPTLAGVAAGVVSGMLMPIVGVVLGSVTANTFDARGLHRPVPLGRWEQGLMFFGFGALLALALARVSGRTVNAPAAAPAVP
ncbi:hypothetical protein [Alienimonas californiensis]|uniref:Uncharacterized protein n=1 Tax=Alienimonas californiensis TaxID=2527989 RepID=A0A517PFS4_9PLAN|nr:hypothetical protein [Alienimonas californiensis]QDT18209.1 hypothetical protein CA12_43500 [Alienimonas californiensis]